jgi:cell division protein FtsI/penicillin-binding protein 2
MANVAAAIGNGGTLMRPQMVKSITAWDAAGGKKRIHTLAPEVLGRPNVRPESLAAMRRGMEAVMQTGGTASSSRLPGVKSAGKTGTAQVRVRGVMVNNAWFIGYAPAENPQIAVCVFVEHAGHGGDVAAPIARKVMAKYLNISVGETEAARSSD